MKRDAWSMQMKRQQKKRQYDNMIYITIKASKQRQQGPEYLPRKHQHEAGNQHWDE